MPAARESLLDAAYTALARRSWPGVRMVDVAAVAGVSRQTLYNEFGSKDGLARALLRRETDGYLHGVERALAEEREPADRLAAVAAWTVGAARGNPLVRAALTGCWGERLPAPSRVTGSSSPVPAQRRADAGVPSSAELLALVRDRAVVALGGRGLPGSPTSPWPARAPSASPCPTSSRPRGTTTTPRNWCAGPSDGGWGPRSRPGGGPAASVR
ncbi:hypothetical protein SALBM135S_04374 [Streptomyces alboniger]